MKNSKTWALALAATLIIAGCQNNQVGGGPVEDNPNPTAATAGDDPKTAAPSEPRRGSAQDPPTKAPDRTTGQQPTNPPTASTTAPPTTGGRLLRINVKKGSVFRYQLSSKMDGGTGQAGLFSMDAIVRMTIDSASAGQTVIRMMFEKMDMPALAQAPPEQRKQFEDSYKRLAVLYTVDEQGKVLSVRAEGGPPGSEQAFGSLGSGGATAAFPEGPVRVGDTYSSEQKVQGENVKTTYKVLAFERKNGIDCVKLEMTAAVRNTTQTMHMWIELATGMLVVAEGSMPLPGQGDAKLTTTMRRI